ncbi:MAG TPA: bifunctional phosphopantothenoylcysteine decarboxylase/phosphopantothenate--cysteine ligase CoaBC [Candidatus Gallacutalibacter pullistercoris]|nr:bifunctional phosphopantothenoylcysteine decarboxylase/phosphopantothenate--cysteine ligase CoaBC [Candidatus Gallacutalibacter pullistercoris]
MLKGKTVLLGVSSSIAAYKAASLASMLVKQHAEVHVLMTENATKFISPMVFETLTGNKAPVDTFDRCFQFDVEHVSLAKKADVVMVAPATANVIAKLAHGIADDMLTTTILACNCPKLISPAMNTRMYENPVTQENMETLRRFGWQVVEPASGYLACGDTGAGKLPEPEVLLDWILQTSAREKDMAGLRVLVTAGPTQESLDPVRYLTNHSSGKMGYAIARAAARRGAEVTLVTGPTSLERPRFMQVVEIISAEDMFREVTSRASGQDIIIKAAAVADYTPAQVAEDKLKKKDGDMSIPLVRTKDILGYLGEHRREGQYLCGFSMETRDMLENSRKKLHKKHVDMIAANNVKESGAGFAVDTNLLTLITEDSENALPLMSKEDAANALLDEILKRR